MAYAEQQLKEIIEEEVVQAIGEGWLDRAKMGFHGGRAFAKEVSPLQLVRGDKEAIGKGAEAHQGALTRKGVSLYRKKLLDFADELEKDISMTGVDPEMFGVLPDTLKRLAVDFSKTLGASPEEMKKAMRSARRAGILLERAERRHAAKRKK